MNQNTDELVDNLPIPLHEMLGVPKSTTRQVEVVSGPTTSLTLKVCIPSAPKPRFFVKTLKPGSQPGPHLNLGLREVRFYALIESLAPDPYPNIPKCLNHHISGDEQNYFLVLEDCSVSHQSYESMDFESLKPWKSALAALAKFHQAFTQKLGDDQICALGDNQKQVEKYLGKLTQASDQFRRDHQQVLDNSILSLMQRSIPMIEAFEYEKMRRVHQNELTTILHRDAHLKNFLYPRPDDGEGVIVDWQFWGLGIGAFDLRHLLGSALGPELRHHQKELVRFYYDNYREGLDAVYSWHDCWDDYRKGIIDNLFMPVWQYTGFGWGIERWGKTLEAAVDIYHELECDQIMI